MDLSQIEGDPETPPATAGEGPIYTYRPSLLGAPFTFRLTEKGLVFQAGRRSGVIAYGDIRRMRLSFMPASMQSQRYLTEIWAEGSPKLTIISSSWKSMMIQERQDKNYSAFIAALHRRFDAADGNVIFERGASPFKYWPGFAAFAVVALAMALLIVRALQSDAYAGAAFIAAFMALFMWHGGNFFRRNKPGRYTADALPADLLP